MQGHGSSKSKAGGLDDSRNIARILACLIANGVNVMPNLDTKDRVVHRRFKRLVLLDAEGLGENRCAMQAGDTVGESDATYHDQAGERSETCEAKGGLIHAWVLA